MVEHLLRPIDEEENVHKRMQLRELASINGTFVETFGACRFCGVQGHVQANCPEREKMESYRAPAELVTCKICGDGGHPTRDCPLAGNVAAAVPSSGGGGGTFTAAGITCPPCTCMPAGIGGGGGGARRGGTCCW